MSLALLIRRLFREDTIAPIAVAAAMFATVVVPRSAAGQGTAALAPPVKMTAKEDHSRILRLLQIASLRPGASANKSAQNAANFEEAKANPFPVLPDPLMRKSGERVTTATDWWNQRRPEIVEDFDSEVYGRAPIVTPSVTWRVISTTRESVGKIPVVTKHLIGHVNNSAYPLISVNIEMSLTIPAKAKRPTPVMLQYGFPDFVPFAPDGRPVPITASVTAAPARGLPGFDGPPEPIWQQKVVAKGWGYALLDPTSVQRDRGAALTGGIIGLVNKGQPRKLDDWGALRAWSWGASRAMDYFEMDKTVDAKHIGIAGHSQFGKAALVTMAYEPRFAIAYVSSSGEAGAELYRRNWGETGENVAGVDEYHWMAGSFLKYAGPLKWNDLPVDSHELIALCAPRPVFIGSGSTKEDGWVDAKGMFMAAVAAGPVYTLLGKKDLGTMEFPPVETALLGGDIAFRQHSGGHTDVPNWPVFLAFASRYIKAN